MQTINSIYNRVSLAGWLAVQILSTITLYTDGDGMKQDHSENFATPIFIMQLVQTLQLLDIIFILLGISKGNILSSVSQIAGRLLVAWVYTSTKIAPLPIANMLIAWSLAETNRYLYYEFKNNLTEFFRYNAFIVLYPIGIYGEMTVINDYINKTSLTELQILMVRITQGCIVVGGVFLYFYMLGNRRKKQKTHKKKSVKA